MSKRFKDRNDESELKVRQNGGKIQYDRIELTGQRHDHEFVTVNTNRGTTSEGVALAHYERPKPCPHCGGYH